MQCVDVVLHGGVSLLGCGSDKLRGGANNATATICDRWKGFACSNAWWKETIFKSEVKVKWSSSDLSSCCRLVEGWMKVGEGEPKMGS